MLFLHRVREEIRKTAQRSTMNVLNGKFLRHHGRPRCDNEMDKRLDTVIRGDVQERQLKLCSMNIYLDLAVDLLHSLL